MQNPKKFRENLLPPIFYQSLPRKLSHHRTAQSRDKPAASPRSKLSHSKRSLPFEALAKNGPIPLSKQGPTLAIHFSNHNNSGALCPSGQTIVNNGKPPSTPSAPPPTTANNRKPQQTTANSTSPPSPPSADAPSRSSTAAPPRHSPVPKTPAESAHAPRR
jgi:hypothetical protein